MPSIFMGLIKIVYFQMYFDLAKHFKTLKWILTLLKSHRAPHDFFSNSNCVVHLLSTANISCNLKA